MRVETHALVQLADGRVHPFALTISRPLHSYASMRFVWWYTRLRTFHNFVPAQGVQ